MMEFEKPRADETEIIGSWALVEGKMTGDLACKRINALVSQYLEEVGRDESGWDTLYRDPEDGRFWEKIYRMSEMHGGGPPALFCLSETTAANKYPHLFE